MKIFYAVQATGNGHIARAIELLPYLQQYGEVHFFLSGSNSSLPVNLPVKYRSKGVSLFYNRKGQLDYYKMMYRFNAFRVWKEANDLPVEKYDLVLIDFESIASLACKLKNVFCMGFGHQASFQSSDAPRPAEKSFTGEWLLKNYSTASTYTGLHFKNYDRFIYNPIVKKSLINKEPVNGNHITVYLPHYNDDDIINHLQRVPGKTFQLFSRNAGRKSAYKNIVQTAIDTDSFNKSLLTCEGIITGAGFETPAEALYLGKKLMCIPVKGQYEQWCNAAALKEFSATIINSVESDFHLKIVEWLNKGNPDRLILNHSTEHIVEEVIGKAGNH